MLMAILRVAVSSGQLRQVASFLPLLVFQQAVTIVLMKVRESL